MAIGQRVAVVTGGASGIGRALCLAFAQRGAAVVVVADLDGPGAAEVAAQIGAGGHRALAVTANMARQAAGGPMIGNGGYGACAACRPG